VLVFGHGPEDGEGPRFNTLPSFPWLRGQGVDGVELDVRRTADDVVVVIHDAALDGQAVSSMAHADLPEWVPTLESALDVCRAMTVIVELKNFPEDPGFDPTQRLVHLVLQLLADRGSTDDVVLSSFGTQALDVVRREAAHLTTAALLFGREPTPARLQAVADAGHPLAHPYDAMVDEAFVAEAERLGLGLDVWMLDVTAERYRQLAAWGVHGVITSQIHEATAATATEDWRRAWDSNPR
jgi:glycerophosphoryl diester phosphodiesterase